MAFVIAENTHETTTSTNSPWTLLGAETGAYAYDDWLANNDTTYYVIKRASTGLGANQIECGIGLFSTTGPTITRVAVISSTNGDSAITDWTGTSDIYCSLPGAAAETIFNFADSGLLAKTAATTFDYRSITGGQGITVTNGDGVSGNPTISLSSGVFIVTDSPYLAAGDGTTDDSSAIQSAINACEAANGGTVLFPVGTYYLGTTGISTNSHSVVLQGVAPQFVQTSYGSGLTYSGTGTAVKFGDSSASSFHRNQINSLQIRATGAAMSSSTARGLEICNQHGFSSRDLSIKDFNDGYGLMFDPDGSGNFNAGTNFYNIQVHDCWHGLDATVSNSADGSGVAAFFGGSFLCDGVTANRCCAYLSTDTDGFMFYAVDFESGDVNVDVRGNSHRFIGCRTEFQNSWGIQINSAVRTFIIGHQWSGSASESDTLDDNGGLTTRIDSRGMWDPQAVRVAADKSEVFVIEDADNNIIFDVSTAGVTDGDVAFPNGCRLAGFSDAFTTEKWRLFGDTGAFRAQTITAAGTPSGSLTGEVMIGGDTSTTACPMVPAGYIHADIQGVAQRIPYYATTTSQTLLSTGASPSVSGVRVCSTQNSGTTNITSFSNGVADQDIIIIGRDGGNTSLIHSGTIIMKGGANVTLSDNTAVHLVTYNGSVWIEV